MVHHMNEMLPDDRPKCTQQWMFSNQSTSTRILKNCWLKITKSFPLFLFSTSFTTIDILNLYTSVVFFDRNFFGPVGLRRAIYRQRDRRQGVLGVRLRLHLEQAHLEIREVLQEDEVPLSILYASFLVCLFMCKHVLKIVKQLKFENTRLCKVMRMVKL